MLANLSRLRIRIEKGVKPELLSLVTLRGIGRIRARILFNSGIKTIDDIKKVQFSRLKGLPQIGSKLALNIKEQVGIYEKRLNLNDSRAKKEIKKQKALTDF